MSTGLLLCNSENPKAKRKASTGLLWPGAMLQPPWFAFRISAYWLRCKKLWNDDSSGYKYSQCVAFSEHESVLLFRGQTRLSSSGRVVVNCLSRQLTSLRTVRLDPQQPIQRTGTHARKKGRDRSDQSATSDLTWSLVCLGYGPKSENVMLLKSASLCRAYVLSSAHKKGRRGPGGGGGGGGGRSSALCRW